MVWKKIIEKLNFCWFFWPKFKTLSPKIYLRNPSTFPLCPKQLNTITLASRHSFSIHYNDGIDIWWKNNELKPKYVVGLGSEIRVGCSTSIGWFWQAAKQNLKFIEDKTEQNKVKKDAWFSKSEDASALIIWKFYTIHQKPLIMPVSHDKRFCGKFLVFLLGIFRRAPHPSDTRGHPCALLLHCPLKKNIVI
jgi:hypothetical protein